VVCIQEQEHLVNIGIDKMGNMFLLQLFGTLIGILDCMLLFWIWYIIVIIGSGKSGGKE